MLDARCGLINELKSVFLNFFAFILFFAFLFVLISLRNIRGTTQ
jgi:hypothetical protein